MKSQLSSISFEVGKDDNFDAARITMDHKSVSIQQDVIGKFTSQAEDTTATGTLTIVISRQQFETMVNMIEDSAKLAQHYQREKAE